MHRDLLASFTAQPACLSALLRLSELFRTASSSWRRRWRSRRASTGCTSLCGAHVYTWACLCGHVSVLLPPTHLPLRLRWLHSLQAQRPQLIAARFDEDEDEVDSTSSHQPRKGASRMLSSLMAKRCRYQARPRGTCVASARRSPANSRLKPNRGYSWMTLWRTASGISLLRRPNTSTAAPADRR